MVGTPMDWMFKVSGPSPVEMFSEAMPGSPGAMPVTVTMLVPVPVVTTAPARCS